MSEAKQKLLELEQSGNYVFHGSPLRLEKLEPRQAYNGTIDGVQTKDGEPAVFTTPNIDIAIFRAIINLSNCPKGCHSAFSKNGNGDLIFTATQDSLDQLADDTKGFIHVFDKNLFKERTPLQWISFVEVIPTEVVTVYKEDLPEQIIITQA